MSIKNVIFIIYRSSYLTITTPIIDNVPQYCVNMFYNVLYNEKEKITTEIENLKLSKEKYSIILELCTESSKSFKYINTKINLINEFSKNNLYLPSVYSIINDNKDYCYLVDVENLSFGKEKKDRLKNSALLFSCLYRDFKLTKNDNIFYFCHDKHIFEDTPEHLFSEKELGMFISELSDKITINKDNLTVVAFSHTDDSKIYTEIIEKIENIEFQEIYDYIENIKLKRKVAFICDLLTPIGIYLSGLKRKKNDSEYLNCANTCFEKLKEELNENNTECLNSLNGVGAAIKTFNIKKIDLKNIDDKYEQYCKILNCLSNLEKS